MAEDISVIANLLSEAEQYKKESDAKEAEYLRLIEEANEKHRVAQMKIKEIKENSLMQK